MSKRFVVCFLFLGIVSLMFSQNRKYPKKIWSEKEIDALIEKSELIPIQITGDKDNRINVVIMNQWTSSESEPYNSPAMRDEFIKDINNSLVAALTYGDERAKTAYANYKEFFNVYGLWVPDVPEWKKGIDVQAVDAIRDKLFLPWKDEHKGWVTFLVMPNRDKGGGGAARNLEKRYGTAVIAGNGIGKMLHEISHTCMSLGDEYTAVATGTSAFPTYASDIEHERDKIKWKKWIEPTTPLPTPYEQEYLDKVGAFEGNQYHLINYFRPTAQGCIMGAGVFDNTEEMCPVCDQRVSMRVYDLVNPINHISPSNTSINIDGKTKLHFAVDHITPQPNTQVVRWILNGKIIATNIDEIDVEFGAISQYKLTCSITDETSYIRPDPPYAKFPKFEVTWNISNTSPTSNAKKLVVTLDAKQKDKKSETSNTIKPTITGGKPPYNYMWSTGGTDDILKDAGVGIYDLTVIDSEYRKAKAHYTIYKSRLEKNKTTKAKKKDEAIEIITTIKASEIKKNNGAVALQFTGGTPPYHVQWKNAKFNYGANQIYEAENATFEISDYEIKTILSASNNSFVHFKNQEGKVSWNVEVANSGIYPVEVIYGGILMKGSYAQISINEVLENESMRFNQTRPLYTGWDSSVINVYLKEGYNKITLVSNGQSLPNIDYIRVPSTVKTVPVSKKERINLSPDNYSFVVTDANKNVRQGMVAIPEVYPFEINNIELDTVDAQTLKIVNPLKDYIYKWYTEDANAYKGEAYEFPIHTGNTFSPKTKGNYYVSAKNNLTKAESVNRIGFAVGDIADKRKVAINPLELERESMLLWFDASDINGDRKTDVIAPERGPVKTWKDKSRNTPNSIFVKYEPNKINGKGVAALDHVWVSVMKEKVVDYQTIILVYKESSMSFPGASPYRALNGIIGKSKDSKKAIFDEDTIDEKTKNGKVYLNGKKIDPFTTANPMDYCILTVELESKSNIPFSRVEGLWEASVAEMIFINRALTNWERKGIEEYLRRKWLSSVDLKFE
ncbi:M64 family metallopeptidase [Flavivirga aquimarina]|uniref:M64 family metallopeptidase n=1 Tax=Flavivirga aquimarina TaxID=2027862 RepID=A0ABT8WDZ0_9FLAO|nr:M64 family metallopeptidase [Flavivirga aquimarina]MDO5971328.1 M64 family metallopeptidase [Flavivirga aquimarina]